MRNTILVIAASALALAPTAAFAQERPDPGTGPAHATGQPGVECGEDDALGIPSGETRGPGSPFQEDSISGSHYAGEQDQNSKNSASVSQYDVACEKVP
jgi:hypothetical protein